MACLPAIIIHTQKDGWDSMKPMFKIMTLILTAALFLTACGSNNGGDSGSSPSASSNSPENSVSTSPSPGASGSAEPAAGPIVLKDAKGEVTLEKPAVRVVALEWTFSEDLIAVGVQPAGNADNEGYGKWVTQDAALGSDVQDIGTRQEPNLEAIAALKPDLIIGVSFRHDKIYDQLKGIATTLIFNPYPEDNGGVDQYSDMEQTFRTIAAAVGKTPEADAVLSDLDKHYADSKAKLEQAGKGGKEFVLTQAFSNQNAAELRLFTDNSMAAATLAKIGLKNAWKSDKFEVYGYSTASVEALTNVQNAEFLYVVQETDDVFADKLKDNPVWKNLQFVKDNRTYPLGGSTWLFGGPISAKAFVDRTVDALTK